MKRLFFLSIILLSLIPLQAQNAKSALKGLIKNSQTAEPLPFVNVVLLKDSIQVSNAQSDVNGYFFIPNIDTGDYSIKAVMVGYQSIQLIGIKVLEKEIKFVNIKMKSSSIELNQFVITEYKNKLIDKGNTTVKSIVSEENFQNMAVRSASKVSSYTSSGAVYSYDDGNSNLNIRGSRSSANYYYVDGMKVSGASILPKTSQPIYPNEKYQAFADNTFKKVELNPLSTFSVDVDHASYTNIRRYINQGYLPPVDAIRIEEMVNYFSYDYSQPKNDLPFSISTEYTDCPWDISHKLVHIGIQGKEIEMKNAPSNNLVFLIDVSGSMSSVDKLGLIKTGLNLLIDQLRKQDRVAIVVYAGAAGLVLPSTSGAHKTKIKSVIESLSAGGSTAGGAGIQLAYKIAKSNYIPDGNNRIILATDGDFNIGISDKKELIQLIESKRDDNIFLTVLGFGTGNIRDSNMEQLANKGNGNYNYIDNAIEAKKVFVSELGGTLITIAKDVKVQVEFNPEVVKGYRLIGYVNRKLNDEDFNDDTKDAGEIGSGHTVTMLYEIIPANSTVNEFDIDALKYQHRPSPKLESEMNNEVLTVKFRYKDPKGTESKLITEVLKNNLIPLSEAPNYCRFSASVASFGLLLRKSDFKSNYGYSEVIDLAKKSKGIDENGTRSEFIQLVKMVAML